MNSEGEDEIKPKDLLLKEAVRRLMDEFGIPNVKYTVSMFGVWVWHDHRITMTAIRYSIYGKIEYAIGIHCTSENAARSKAILADLELEFDFLTEVKEADIDQILQDSTMVFLTPNIDEKWLMKQMDTYIGIIRLEIRVP
jgi:hypothetical protein